MGQVLTVHPGQSLIQLVVQFVLEKVDESDPFSLSDVTIYVPSPRLAKSMRESFVEALGQGMLLPQVKAFSFAEEEGESLLFEDLEANPTGQEVVGSLPRLMLLSRFVAALDSSLSFAQCLGSATTLATLFNRLTTHSLSRADLMAALPGEMAQHFERNLNFLDIALSSYPQWLAEKGAIDSAQLSKEILLSQAELFTVNRPQKLTIAAGFSDTTPAGIEVLKALITLENGYLILPGLDRAMAEDAFETLSPSHPQYTMKEMLEKLEVKRSNVAILGAEKVSAKAHLWRLALMPVSAFQPEELRSEIPQEAFAGLSLLEAETEQEEAELIALLMREALEEKSKTCALVTSDRALARRVRSALRRWDIEVDDSAGEPLLLTPLGQLFKLCAQAAESDFPPLVLAALLKHPYCRMGQSKSGLKKQIQALEMCVLRGEQPPLGLDGLNRFVDQKKEMLNVPQAGQELSAERLARKMEELNQAQSLLHQLETLYKASHFDIDAKHSISEWISWHIKLLLSFTTPAMEEEVLQTQAENLLEEDAPIPELLQTDAGEALLMLLESWQGAHHETGFLSMRDYVESLDVLMSTAVVRPKYKTHPRLFIWGPLEARMQQVDRLILGGVNEGVWPRKISADPWLNRVLSQNLGLPEKEVALGMASHDFVSLASMKDVFMTRAVRDSEGESVPSRFLARLEALLKQEDWACLKNNADVWKKRLQKLDEPQKKCLKNEAQVLVPVEKRSKVWSASHMKDLMQCPYKAYATKVLGLKALDMYEPMANVADKGNLIHQALEAFFAPIPKGDFTYKGDMEREAMLSHLLYIGRHIFAEFEGQSVHPLWWQKFEQIASSFVDQMLELHLQGRTVWGVEKKAMQQMEGGITIHARIDRLDLQHNECVIVDYKTGKIPEAKQVKNGTEPQMAVLAYLAEEGAFGALQGVSGIEYWVLKGGVEVKSALPRDLDMAELISQTREGVNALIAHFNDETVTYEAIPGDASGQSAVGPCRYCDYAGLCRYKDWYKAPKEKGEDA